MSEQKCRKVYVPVNLDVDAEGLTDGCMRSTD